MANKSMSSANDSGNHESRASFRKTASTTGPPEGYIKRVSCPSRQQFYKDLQQQEQTRAEGPRKVYHACSKYKCPRAPREPEAPFPEVRASDVRARPKKKPPGAREEGDRVFEETRKTKLSYVVEKKRFRPPQKHRKGVGNPAASNEYRSALVNYTAPPPAPTIDEGVQAYCKEATRNSALYTTQAGEQSEQTDRARDSEIKLARPAERCKPRSGSSSKRFDGLSEHLKYGLFRRRHYFESDEYLSSSRNVFGPAAPPQIGLDKERRNIPPGLGSDVPPAPGRSCLATPRHRPCLVMSNIMHVDIKPRAHGYMSPPGRKNNIAQGQKWPVRSLRSRSFVSSPTFAHPKAGYNPSFSQATPIGYHRSTIVRVPSSYPQNHPMMPVYCRITPCPSRVRDVAPQQYYNRHSHEVLRIKKSPLKKGSPFRNLTRHSKSYDRQLTSPYSRTRSSQSPGAFMRQTTPKNLSKVTDTESTLQPNPILRSKKSQHSITSSVHFETLSTLPKKVTSINRNIGTSKSIVPSKSQFLRRVLSMPSKKERTTTSNVIQRSPTHKLRNSPRDMIRNQETAAKLRSQIPNQMQASTDRNRTFNRCLTPTLTRKILSGEVVKPSNVNTRKVNTGVDTLTPKKNTSSSSCETSPERHITSISTQTLI